MALYENENLLGFRDPNSHIYILQLSSHLDLNYLFIHSYRERGLCQAVASLTCISITYFRPKKCVIQKIYWFLCVYISISQELESNAGSIKNWLIGKLSLSKLHNSKIDSKSRSISIWMMKTLRQSLFKKDKLYICPHHHISFSHVCYLNKFLFIWVNSMIQFWLTYWLWIGQYGFKFR